MDLIKDNLKLIVLLPIALLITVVVASFFVIQKEASKVYEYENPELASAAEDIEVGIVFGSGVGLEEPSPIVKERLDMAKQLLKDGIISKIILSGDNRVSDYNEPAIMHKYLLSVGVSPSQLQQDPAGLSTYETCERANKVYGLVEAVLISESTHLPRAIYTCGYFGVETIGVNSDKSVIDSSFVNQYAREILARFKAIYNVYISGENTILGEPINIE